jgi:hypothetical protein
MYICTAVASKTLDLWNTPPVLVIHFKRLIEGRKLGQYVEIPLKGFDPKLFLAKRFTNAPSFNTNAGNQHSPLHIQGHIQGHNHSNRNISGKAGSGHNKSDIFIDKEDHKCDDSKATTSISNTTSNTNSNTDGKHSPLNSNTSTSTSTNSVAKTSGCDNDLGPIISSDSKNTNPNSLDVYDLYAGKLFYSVLSRSIPSNPVLFYALKSRSCAM